MGREMKLRRVVNLGAQVLQQGRPILRQNQCFRNAPQLDQLAVDLHGLAVRAEHEQAVQRGVHRGLQELKGLRQPVAHCGKRGGVQR